jgi:hypothetical protein
MSDPDTAGAEQTTRWRWHGGVLGLGLFLGILFLIEGRDLVIFTQNFAEVRKYWLPVQAVVKNSSIAYRSARSSGNSRAAPARIMLYTVFAEVSYTLDERSFDVAAGGWEERYRIFSRWEQSGLEAGRTVRIRIRPDAPDHATLLGEWSPPSLVQFARYIAVELLLLCGVIVCARFMIQRA